MYLIDTVVLSELRNRRRHPGFVRWLRGTTADGHCRPFDAQATGTVPGRGLGVVVLKRLADAVADGDTIYAVVKGSAIGLAILAGLALTFERPAVAEKPAAATTPVTIPAVAALPGD